MRILIVDDEAAVVEVLTEFLEARGHAVTALCSGRVAVGGAAALAWDHDVAVVDWHMPGMGGRDVLAALLAARPGLPVLVATGDRSPRIRGVGDVAVLEKPFKLAHLLARLSDLVGDPGPVEHRSTPRE